MEVRTNSTKMVSKIAARATGLAGLLLLGTGVAHAGTRSGKADAFLTRQMAAPVQSGWASVIVKIDGDLDPARQARLTALNASVTRRLPFVHAAAVRVPTRNLAKLAGLPFVAHLSLDGAVKKNDAFTVSSSGADVAFAQYGLAGQGVTVAVVDSGIRQDDQDLQTMPGAPGQPAPPKPLAVPGGPVPSTLKPGPGGSRIRYSVSFTADDKSTGTNHDVDDQCGHGTHVAGIIAGDGAQSAPQHCNETFYGIAPQADLVNVRVLGADGSGTVDTVLAGLQWVYYNAHQYNIRVVNLSIGHPVGESYTTDPLCQAVEVLWQEGVVVVCAAGNDGRLNGNTYTAGLDNEGWGTAYGSIDSPGNDPCVITVGAMKSMDRKRADDRVATYSSRGPARLDLTLKPDIVAPGNRVISLEAANNCSLATAYSGTNQIPQSMYMKAGDTTKMSNAYFRLSGTSMATPVVSAAAALLLQKDPTLTPDTVKARLMLAADKWAFPDGTGDPCTFGAGYLNIPAALACTVVAQGPALSPALAEDDQGDVYLDMSRAMWGNSLWGTGVTDTRAIWGSHALWGNTTLDATRAMWGNSTLSSSNALWGKSVWSDRAMWGNSTAAADLSTTAIYGETDVNDTEDSGGSTGKGGEGHEGQHGH